MFKEEDFLNENIYKLIDLVNANLYWKDIPAEERFALRQASAKINHIADILLKNYTNIDAVQTQEIEEREPILVAPVLLQMLTEKKYQYQEVAVQFGHCFSSDGEFSRITIQPTALKRMLSNLIDNSVYALDQRQGTIILHLDADDEQVHITIEDNAKGMSPELIQKIKKTGDLAENNEADHGFGLAQVRDILRDNLGLWYIDSEVGVGTKFKLAFLRSPALNPPAESLQLHVGNDGRNSRLRDSDFKKTDVIFVDDEASLLEGFRYYASDKHVDTYSDPAIFLENIDQYRKNTKIFLDQNFTNFSKTGIQIAEQVYAMGFTRLYLFSGGSFSKIEIPHFLTFIAKGEMQTLKAALDE